MQSIISKQHVLDLYHSAKEDKLSRLELYIDKVIQLVNEKLKTAGENYIRRIQVIWDANQFSFASIDNMSDRYFILNCVATELRKQGFEVDTETDDAHRKYLFNIGF